MHDFITAWNKSTGRKQRIPRHYLTSPVFKGVFALPPSKRARARKTADAKTSESATPSITDSPADGGNAKENPDA